jgi:hypothetical protein
MGMDFKLAPYQDWTARLLRHLRATRLPIQNNINFDMMCRLYFQIEKGEGLEIDGSKGVYDMYKEEQQDFPPFGPD